MKHERVLYPVGQGGFAIELLDGFVVAFDCGSSTSTGIVESCIDSLTNRISRIDVLFISHFDNDHVNSIRYLLENVTVVKAVSAMIPDDMKVAYGIYTDGAYGTIMSLLREKDVPSDTVGEQETHFIDSSHIWEWVAKSMMSSAEFNQIRAELRSRGLDMTRLDDAKYLEPKRKRVNGAFKKVFGSKGPNTKGLIVLSQKASKVGTLGCVINVGYSSQRLIGPFKESSCLYVGDADLRNKEKKAEVQAFLQYYKTESNLLLMQIPHHGSQFNRGVDFEEDFPARLYFVNDVDTRRLQNNPKLLNSLTQQKALLVVSDRLRDLVVGVTGL